VKYGTYDTLPISTEPLIKGRVPSPWMMDHGHCVTQDEFYNFDLSEDDLKRIVATRGCRPGTEWSHYSTPFIAQPNLTQENHTT